MDAAYSEKDSASSMSDPDEHHELPPAVNAAYYLHHQKKIEVFRAFEHVISGIRDGTFDHKTDDEIPVLPVRGEYTLYSPQYVALHYKNNPTLWTKQFADIWTAAEELGGGTEEDDYMFVGILDRTEEDMEIDGFVKDYCSRPVPHYEAPFMSTLPQGRTRYLPPTCLGSDEPSTPASPLIHDKMDPTTGQNQSQMSPPAINNLEAGNASLTTAELNVGNSVNGYEEALAKQYAHQAKMAQSEWIMRGSIRRDHASDVERISITPPGL
ncbi:hypothetical protein J4E83_008345 [Alternaria metachromatica]|uniref:uncharacterized protein n=1 Tax=Alternaria metachromatica TaxID=283354 RepID=UPI0020C38389|nr:uncharacterized protein J4E83_008345 [Alternaria metachromatica]KAI4610731.1 hypothetical protein J4E83_008345 [Alternaria metachromatica]